MLVEGHKVEDSKMADDGGFEKYELEEAVKALAKAEEIKADTKLMKAIQPELEKKYKAYMGLEEMRHKAGALKLAENNDKAKGM